MRCAFYLLVIRLRDIPFALHLTHLREFAPQKRQVRREPRRVRRRRRRLPFRVRFPFRFPFRVRVRLLFRVRFPFRVRLRFPFPFRVRRVSPLGGVCLCFFRAAVSSGKEGELSALSRRSSSADLKSAGPALVARTIPTRSRAVALGKFCRPSWLLWNFTRHRLLFLFRFRVRVATRCRRRTSKSNAAAAPSRLLKSMSNVRVSVCVTEADA